MIFKKDAFKFETDLCSSYPWFSLSWEQYA